MEKIESELIRREDAIATIGVMYERCDTNDITDYRDLMLEAVKALPSADRPQGKWIWSPRDTDGTVSGCCSNCSFSHLFIGGHTAQYNYCPSCGCRMKGADDE